MTKKAKIRTGNLSSHIENHLSFGSAGTAFSKSVHFKPPLLSPSRAQAQELQRLRTKHFENEAQRILSIGRKSLSDVGGTSVLIETLKGKVSLLNITAEGGSNPAQRVGKGKGNQQSQLLMMQGDFRDLLAENWVEEVLKFLALKVTLGDTIQKPFQLAPSAQIQMAWNCLMLMPKIYDKLCIDMCGSVIDNDLSDSIITEENLDLMIEKHSRTIESYEEYFKTKPPTLFWFPEPQFIPTNFSHHVFLTKRSIKHSMDNFFHNLFRPKDESRNGEENDGSVSDVVINRE